VGSALGAKTCLATRPVDPATAAAKRTCHIGWDQGSWAFFVFSCEKERGLRVGWRVFGSTRGRFGLVTCFPLPTDFQTGCNNWTGFWVLLGVQGTGSPVGVSLV
jgi:hypothetical protein